MTTLDPSVTPPPPPPGGYFQPPTRPEPAGPERSRQTASAGILLFGIALLAWRSPWGLAVLAGLVLMVFLHELGHFLMAKRAGMKVTEFFLGFGPRLWSFRRGETEYGLKLIPAGAYVKIVGMNNLDEVDPADEARAYRQKAFRDRLGVAVAGSTMHFIQALVLLFVLLTMIGVQGGSLFGSAQPSGAWQVASVGTDTAAQRAGLSPGDRIVSIDDTTTSDYTKLRNAVVDKPDRPVQVVFVHDGVTKHATVTLGHQPDTPAQGMLGITAKYPTQTVGVLAAVPQSFRDFGTVANESVQGLTHLFSPSGIARFYHQVTNTDQSTAGPTVDASNNHQHSSSPSSSSSSADSNADRPLSILGIFRLTTDAGEADGIAAVLAFFVLINVFIGIFNLVPLLPFDGGHVVVAGYEKIQELRRHSARRYFADVSRLLPVTYAVVLVLAGLFASTLYLDIARPIR